ncbi:MAG: methyltransferase domain-containing protein [Deltaproteobacteria bacterium]|nr:methyltransferase domain-containing protein [Deltaproteobacteria bacterium]
MIRGNIVRTEIDNVQAASGRQGLGCDKGLRCRFCDSPLRHVFVDLGMSPLSNAYLKPADLARMEPFYPLVVFVCEKCFLVQLEEFESPGHIFSDYSYFSSFSDSWVEHAKVYTHMIVERFGMDRSHRVVEIASNDGYLLQHFVAREIPVLGIEPAANVAEAAIQKEIPTIVEFFGESLARRLAAEGAGADLIVGNNVLAHVPQLNDFVKGLKILLKPEGIITLEFPHLMRLMEENQFDTIYHEHFSYFSLHAVRQVMAAHGLTLFDVEELSTHGGSLRIYARHQEDRSSAIAGRVADLAARENAAGVTDLKTYVTFGEKVKHTKRKFLDFLIAAKNEGKSVVGYGAPAKGNTLLNYCGVRTDFIDYTVDRSPHKQSHFLPGTHIPIHHPDRIKKTRPDYVLILPWNLTEEITSQMSYIRDWNGRFVVPIPEVKVL